MNITYYTNELVSFYKRTHETNATQSMKLGDLLKELRTSEYLKKITLHARTLGEDEYAAYKKAYFPGATISCCIPEGPRKISNPSIVKNHTIVLDLDHLDESKLEEYKKSLMNHFPSIYYIQKSVSGKGLFCLAAVEDWLLNDLDGVFSWFKKALNEKLGLVLDKLADIVRLRYLAWDPSPAIREDNIIPAYMVWHEERVYNDLLTHKVPVYSQRSINFSDDDKRELLVKALKALCHNRAFQDSYNAYHPAWHFACDLKNIPEGEAIYWEFIRVERMGNLRHWTAKTPEQIWNNAKPSPLTFDELCKKYIGQAKNKIGKYWYKDS